MSNMDQGTKDKLGLVLGVMALAFIFATHHGRIENQSNTYRKIASVSIDRGHSSDELRQECLGKSGGQNMGRANE